MVGTTGGIDNVYNHCIARIFMFYSKLTLVWSCGTHLK